jgi:nucleoside phosphorylase
MTEQQQAGDLTQQDATQQHDFDVQKQVHQQIRNDPDYDDWEYGTEPLPHEAWTAKVSKG